MSQIYPAIQGLMGTTEYFMLTIKANALIEMVKFHTQDKDWQNLSLEERDQRDINFPRVKSKIAPYLANNKRHFMSSVVLLGEGLKENSFERLVSPALLDSSKIPLLYKNEATKFGFLTLTGSEIFKPLDGQHRIMALKYAIKGRDHEGKELSKTLINPDAAKDLANEDVSVLVVKATLKEARKIFNDINSYAKPTTTGQNLVTNDEKTHAVFARRITNERITPNLVNYKSNNLTDKDYEFTTLATIGKATEFILKTFYGKEYINLPEDKNKVKELWGFIDKYWSDFLGKFDLWKTVLEDKKDAGHKLRKEYRKAYLCMRPLAQLAVITAVVTAVHENALSIDRAINKLNDVPWETEAKLWDRVLWSGGKVQSKNARLVTELLKYFLIGDKYQNKETLKKMYLDAFPSDHQPTALPEWDRNGNIKLFLPKTK